MKKGNWSKEEKAEYIDKIKKWKSELVRFEDFNVYYHPDKPYLQYRKTYQNGYVKMVRWTVIDNTFIRCMKDGEHYDIPISTIEAHCNGTSYPAPGGYNKPKNSFSVSIPLSLKNEFNKWISERVESPF